MPLDLSRDDPSHSASHWSGLLDDAAVFPPGEAALPDALDAYATRRGEWWADLVGSFVVRDIDLGSVPPDVPVSVVLTTGAGGIEGVTHLAHRKGHRLVGLETALSDHDDLAANARRVVAAVDAARSSGTLEDDVRIHVELPQGPASPGWLRAADEVAAAELGLKFRTGGPTSDMFPTPDELAGWIDAALDRETPFKCTAGLHRAVRHTTDEGFDRPVDQHGFLNVLVATRLAFDSAGTDAVVSALEERDPDAVAASVRDLDVVSTRRWFTSHGSCSVDEPLTDLLSLGLLEAPR